MRKTITGTGIAALALLAYGIVGACECLEVSADGMELNFPVGQELLQGWEVFVGTVTHTEHLSAPAGDGSGEELLVLATMTVERLWNGERVWHKEIYSYAFGFSCGVSFEVGKRYLVRADVVGSSEGMPEELPPAALFTDRCWTEPFVPEQHEAVVSWYDSEFEAWRPKTHSIQSPISSNGEMPNTAVPADSNPAGFDPLNSNR